MGFFRGTQERDRNSRGSVRATEVLLYIFFFFFFLEKNLKQISQNDGKMHVLTSFTEESIKFELVQNFEKNGMQ